MSRLPRFGGELPAGCDPQAPPGAEPTDCLFFSHGRAALAWLLERRGPFASAVVGAYTCPVVPRQLAAHGLPLAAVDADAGTDAYADAARSLPAPVLVVVPALLGFLPGVDVAALAASLNGHGMVMVDGAQTAFGHLDLPLPPGGAVLSAPRKTLALGDGAVLRLDGSTADDRAHVAGLPELTALSADKMRMRRLLAECGDEGEALSLSRTTEAAWPDTPHRMTTIARAALAAADPAAHAQRRRDNRARLRAALGDALAPAWDGAGTPFCHAVLADDREALIRRLHARRVFATPLWPDSWHDATSHPRAADLCRRLLALPVDQRYDGADMDHLARLVLDAVREGKSG